MAKIPLTDPVAAWSSRATSDNKIIFRPPRHFRRNFALANEHHAQEKLQYPKHNCNILNETAIS